jgi:ATP citrate (pro-S)-lyase
MMREASHKMNLPIHIYGPETHITAIVPLALGLAELEDFPEFDDESHQWKPRTISKKSAADEDRKVAPIVVEGDAKEPAQDMEGVEVSSSSHEVQDFSNETQCVIYGLQQRAVQGMLDFDYMCKRKTPSVAGMIFPFSANHFIKVSDFSPCTIVPVYQIWFSNSICALFMMNSFTGERKRS